MIVKVFLSDRDEFEAKIVGAQAKAEMEHAENVKEAQEELEELKAEVKEKKAVVDHDFRNKIVTIRAQAQKKADEMRSIVLEEQAKAEQAHADRVAAAEAAVDEVRSEADKAARESYITDLLLYAEDCEDLAAAFALEAETALLEATYEVADYNEKYGE